VTIGEPAAAVPFVSTEQMVEVDRVIIEDLGIDLTQMMENAGRAPANLARARFFDGDPRGRRVTLLAGSGGNGGGAMVAARRLHGFGARVEVYVARGRSGLRGVPLRQREILERIGVEVAEADRVVESRPADLVIDGVIGCSLRGAPTGAAAAMIRWANAQSAPILALDTPSGIDPGGGAVFDPAVRADATMTLALPKGGFRLPTAADHVGELYLADISVPPSLYASAAIGIEVGPIFARSDTVRLT
jgi:NAD(P)H-hydrate epimerase